MLSFLHVFHVCLQRPRTLTEEEQKNKEAELQALAPNMSENTQKRRRDNIDQWWNSDAAAAVAGSSVQPGALLLLQEHVVRLKRAKKIFSVERKYKLKRMEGRWPRILMQPEMRSST